MIWPTQRAVYKNSEMLMCSHLWYFRWLHVYSVRVRILSIACDREVFTLFSIEKHPPPPHVFAQLDAAFISKESVEHSWLESFPTPYADVSLAKRAHSFTRHFGKSSINRRKRVGPNTVPWGIPDITVCQDEQLPFTWTHWRRLPRNDENHCSAACENPVWDSL